MAISMNPVSSSMNLTFVQLLAAVRRLVDAAFLVRTEQVSGHRRVNRLRVARIDHDARDGLRLAQADVLEGPAAIGGLVDAVAKRRRLAIVRLSGADIDDVRIGGMDGDVADRRGRVLLEHRLPRSAVVLRLEHAPDRVAHVDDVGIRLRHGDVVDPSPHAGRADRSKPERREQGIVRRVDQARLGDRRGRLSLARSWCGGPDHRTDCSGEQQPKRLCQRARHCGICTTRNVCVPPMAVTSSPTLRPSVAR